jgi:single-stranded-DNA-specific exonuclease
MKKRQETLELEIKNIAKKFLEKSKDKEIKIISHFDTDGITSASIIIKALKKLDKLFSLQIIKRIETGFIENLPKDKIILFLDLGSGNLNELKNFENVFVIDHHEISEEIPESINLINSELYNQKISASGLTYLFCKEFDSQNSEFAKLAILGMIGDCLESEISKLNHGILNDAEIKKKRGLLIYPSTRPINRVLEFSSNPFIPGVTGNPEGVSELLREIELKPTKNGYPSLIELNEEEMSKLITAIMLRNPKANNKQIIGDIFLIKLFNKLEDARELSAKINACSRLGEPEIAIQFCMEISRVKKTAESIHIKYKQELISGLKIASENQTSKKQFILINAQNKIKDTIIGTITSILSNSLIYEKGTIIVGMANYKDKIKISGRNVGNSGRNIREILSKAVTDLDAEVGGHEFAAGCMIFQKDQEKFISNLNKQLEIEVIKI